MNHFKIELMAHLIHLLEADLALLVRAASDAREAATHTESLAEDQYDTRGLEASYLAGAQAARAKELEKVIGFYRIFKLPEVTNDSTISAGMCIAVKSSIGITSYFLVPGGTGRRVDFKGESIQVITTQSPLGVALIGKKCGDIFDFEAAGKISELEVVKLF